MLQENTLRKDSIKLTFAEQDETEKKSESLSDNENEEEGDSVEAADGEKDDDDVEIGIKVLTYLLFLQSLESHDEVIRWSLEGH